MKWLRRWRRPDRGWPKYLPGGRIRTSTAALLIAFVALLWLNQTYEPPPSLTEEPATQVVPPGFVPDPNYTWVPRTNVRRPKEPETTTTPTTTTPTTTPTDTTSPTEPPAPFGPETTGPESPATTSPDADEPTATATVPVTTTPPA